MARAYIKGTSPDLSQLNFGKEAADSERLNLPAYFLSTAEYQRIERGEAWIIRGTKGSGKSAIAVKLQSLKDPRTTYVDVSPSSVGWANLRSSTGFTDLQLKKMAWQAAFLTEVLNVVNKNGWDDFPLDAIDDLLKQATRPTKKEWKLKEIAVSLQNFGFSIGKTDDENVLQVDHGRFAYALSEAFKALDEALASQSHNIRLIVDGFDLYWNATPQDNESVAALFLAAQELFQKTSTIRALVFIRTDMWSRVKWDNSDHVGTDIVDLRWRPESLKELLKRRIEHSLDMEFETPEQAYEIAFETTVRRVQGYNRGVRSWEYMMKLIPKRPRDLIILVEFARKQRADPRAKITGDDLKGVVKQYSTVRYENILSAESAKTVPELTQSAEKLRGSKYKAEWRNLRPLLDPDPKIARQRLNELFEYEICGVKRSSGEEYYEDNPRIMQSEIKDDTYIIVHPGLRKELRLKGPYGE